MKLVPAAGIEPARPHDFRLFGSERADKMAVFAPCPTSITRTRSSRQSEQTFDPRKNRRCDRFVAYRRERVLRDNLACSSASGDAGPHSSYPAYRPHPQPPRNVLQYQPAWRSLMAHRVAFMEYPPRLNLPAAACYALTHNSGTMMVARTR